MEWINQNERPMQLSDAELGHYVTQKLALSGDERNEYRAQVGRLLDKLQRKIEEDASYHIKKFRRAGSLEKGTTNRPRAGTAADADVGVYFEVDDPSDFDIAHLQSLIKRLLLAAYPQKSEEDFEATLGRTFGVVFQGTGLEVDLAPIVSLDDDAIYGYQYSRSGDRVKTSVKVQLDFYREHAGRDSLLSSLIRMSKRWVYWNELDGIHSFHLELLLCYLVDSDGPALGLEEGLRRMFLFIARGLNEPLAFDGSDGLTLNAPVVIADPANRENNVASRITETERDELVASARRALETITWAQGLPGKIETLDAWKEIFGSNFSIE